VKKQVLCEIGEKMNEMTTWKKWMHVKEGKTSRMDCVVKRGTLNECVNEFFDEIDALYSHVFVADWQRQQLQNLKANLPSDWALIQVDFSENFVCYN
jgi:hypothetical protein